ncbi:MFS transporter [Microlunatus elymi]|uniref:MFS transporter n=1 Tax=Microlunatus elymi TaxID=2596828 RepID=UPI001AEF74AC|nr:MFS transporter [Microlunatus elymi]
MQVGLSGRGAGSVGDVAAELRHWFRNDVRDRLESTAGGPARLRVIVLLAGVLALSTADTATVGAIAGELESSLHLTNTQVGLMVTVSVGVGAVATLPAGVLADRFSRTRLLWISVLVWAVAMLVSGLAMSFPMLLVTRLALGAVIATAYPASASLTGDLFSPSERGAIYGYILSGELVGTGIGFLVSGDLAAVLTWRAGFIWLATPSLLLAWAIRRYLPEPARGGQSRLRAGDAEIRSAEEVQREEQDHAGSPGRSSRNAARSGPDEPGTDEAEPDEIGRDAVDPDDVEEGEVEQKIQEQQVPARDHLVLHEDPTHKSLWWAVRYTLSIPTNLILIVASGLGYFFLQGLETFFVVYLRSRYGLSQSTASSLLVVLGCGAIVGVLVTGWSSDRLIHRGWITARPILAGVSFIVAVGVFVPALLAGALLVAAPLLFVAAAGLGGTNPPLNAARLDLVHSRLWGRAEAVRTGLSTALQAIAPLLFGYVSTLFGGQSGRFGESSASGGGQSGLEQTFLIMLVPLLVAGLLLLIRARVTYPPDVASAVASEHAVHAAEG